MCLTLGIVLFAFGCNHKGKDSAVNEVTITVKGDAGLQVAEPSTFKVKKNSTWKSIKKTATGSVTVKANKIIREWRLGDANGVILENMDVFEKDETIFAVSLEPQGMVNLVLNLKGGTTTTKMEDGVDGTKILRGKPGEEVEIKELAKKDHFLEGWTPPLPARFDHSFDGEVYTACWKEGIRVNIIGDERLEVKDDNYIDLPSGSNKTFAEIKNDVLSKVSLNEKEWDPMFYDIYDFKLDGEDGVKITDATQIASNTTIYVRSNYKRFRGSIKRIVGYYVQAPRGRIIIAKDVTSIRGLGYEVTGIDISECTELTDFDLSGANIKTLDASKCPKLEYFNLTGCGRLQDVNFTGCAKLSSLFYNHNYSCFSNCRSLKNVNLTGCAGLKTTFQTRGYGELRLAFSDCSLETINLKDCTGLEELYLSDDAITNLDVSSCNKLSTLVLQGLPIASLDVSQLTKLETIDLSNTFIESINLSACTKLEVIRLENTLIKDIDALNVKSSVLRLLDLSGTLISKVELAKYKAMKNFKMKVSNCPNLKSLSFKDFTEMRRLSDVCSFSGCEALESLDLTNCARLEYINNNDINGCNILKTVNLGGCSSLMRIDLPHTSITSLDLTKCTNLNQLDLSHTSITSLDLTKCANLNQLDLSHTSIASLDLTKCTNLNQLDLSHTSIASLDLTKCNNLQNLFLFNNTAITSIDLSQCSQIQLSYEYNNGDRLPRSSFSGCINAVVKLPYSYSDIMGGCFGSDTDTWCKKVQIPNGADSMENRLLNAGYPAERIERY